MSTIELIQGDCLEKMKDIPDGAIDFILCDLPYGTTYCEFDGVLKNMDRYSKKSIVDLDLLWAQYKRIIKGNGAIVLFGSQPFTTVLIASNFPMYKYIWVWEKNKAGNHVAVKFQPLKVHEDIVVFSRAGVNTGTTIPIKYNPQDVIWKTGIKTRKNDIRKEGSFRYNSLKAGNYTISGTNYPISILSYSIPLGKERVHPTQKPVGLCEYLIKTYTNEGDLVLDNCMGSGTTGVACKNLNRNFIGIELDPEYFKIAEKRIMEFKKEGKNESKS